MKLRKQLKRFASVPRWTRALKYLAVVLAGTTVVAWGIKTGDNEETQGSTYPGRESGSWISSLPLEVADGPGSQEPAQTEHPGKETPAGIESYPAAYLEKLEPERAIEVHAAYLDAHREFREAWLENVEGIKPKDYLQAKKKGQRITIEHTPFFELDEDWYIVGPHPYLAEVLPGVSFYLSPPGPSIPGAGGTRFLFAVRGAKFYDMPDELNRLLYDCGMRFGNADVPVWARMLILLSEARRSLIHPPWHSSQEAWMRFMEVFYGKRPFIPEIAFEDVVLDTTTEESIRDFARVGYVQEVRIRYRAGSITKETRILTSIYERSDGSVCVFPWEGEVVPAAMPRPPSGDVDAEPKLKIEGQVDEEVNWYGTAETTYYCLVRQNTVAQEPEVEFKAWDLPAGYTRYYVRLVDKLGERGDVTRIS